MNLCQTISIICVGVKNSSYEKVKSCSHLEKRLHVKMLRLINTGAAGKNYTHATVKLETP